MTELSRRTLLGAGAALSGAYSSSQPWIGSDPLQLNRAPLPSMLPAQPTSSGILDIASFGEFGGIGDGSTNNATAWQKIADWASRRGSAGNTPKINLRAGRYVSTSIPNLAINRLHIECEGEVWLINTGPGHSFVLDGGAKGAGVYGLRIIGWPQIYGRPDSQHGIFARAIFNSEIELNCRGAGASSSGLHCEWLVDNKIRFIMSSNEGGLYSKPNGGVHLTERADNEQTSYNDIELKLSGMDTGITLDSALGNNVRSGSIQNCRLGMHATRKAWDNKFWGTDFESNGLDFRDASLRLSLHGCDVNTAGTFDEGSSGARVFGGRVESVTVSRGAENVLFSGMGYNRSGAGRLVDAGNRARYRDVFNIADNLMHDGQI